MQTLLLHELKHVLQKVELSLQCHTHGWQLGEVSELLSAGEDDAPAAAPACRAQPGLTPHGQCQGQAAVAVIVAVIVPMAVWNGLFQPGHAGASWQSSILSAW